MRKPTGRKEQKLLQMRLDMEAILNHIKIMGPSSRDTLLRTCKISIKQISNRLKKLQHDGLNGEYIKTVRYGSYNEPSRDKAFSKTKYGALWALGKQEKIIKNYRRRDPKIPPPNTSFKLEEMPNNIQRWFGSIPGFIPAQGQHIEESMPSWANRNSGTSIGNGSYAYLNSMGEI